jgi:uncharacterized protein
MSITEDQTAVIEFLGAASTHGGRPVDRIETHISIVFLAGSRAWKLKRAVHFDYIDASTLERRRALCEKEVQLNRRTAASLYRGVVAVTRGADGSLSLGGSGTPVEWLVDMNRFDEDAVFDRLAQRGRLGLALMLPLASAIARFHRVAEPRRHHGGTPGMRWVIDGNAAGFAEFGSGLFDPAAVVRVNAATLEELDRCARLLDARREDGFVRHCHGDLHLRNIVLYDGHPTLFDGIEFNDEIACVDVLYDLAFLLMDLWRRRLPAHANAVWNRYLSDTGDVDGIGLMPLFLSCRAAIRAKTNATALRLRADTPRATDLQTTAREYLSMAELMLQHRAPCLVAIGGRSGSGKSTVARAIAPLIGTVPGGLVLRSDEIRKRIRGVPALTRLGPEGYTSEVTERVYATLTGLAALALRGGYSAVVDATFLDIARRQAIERAARASGVPFVGLWLEAPDRVLLDRLRQREHDASDADAVVFQKQGEQTAGAISWQRLDGSAPADVVRDTALRLLDRHVNEAATSALDADHRLEARHRT